jgi:hypothetical protein
MRIAYLTEWSPYSETGVLRKLVKQVATWRDLGMEAELFIICPTDERDPAYDFNSFGRVFGSFSADQLRAYPFARLGYFNKILSVPKTARALRSFRPDVIYYRQHGPWYPGLGKLLSIAPTVLEINSREDIEPQLWGYWQGVVDRHTKARVLSKAAGFVSMTEEIAEYYRPFGKPVDVVPNALDIYPPQILPTTGNLRPAYVMIATPLDTSVCWHGADKLFDLAAALPNHDFHVAGYSASHYSDRVPLPNLTFHGYLGRDALTRLLARCDIGIASLAAHRKGLKEGCALKTRTYLSYGLPVIIGYIEAEKGLSGQDFVLPIDNHEENVRDNVGPISEFAERWRNSRVPADLGFMSSETKERQRLAFFDRVLAQAHTPH